MELKTYLIVYGTNTLRGGACYKETEIDDFLIEKFSGIIKKIIENIDKPINWIWGIDLIPNKDKTIPFAYFDRCRLFNMYPDLSPSLLIDFSNYLPSGITKIESIKIFRGEKVKII